MEYCHGSSLTSVTEVGTIGRSKPSRTNRDGKLQNESTNGRNVANRLTRVVGLSSPRLGFIPSNNPLDTVRCERWSKSEFNRAFPCLPYHTSKINLAPHTHRSPHPQRQCYPTSISNANLRHE